MKFNVKNCPSYDKGVDECRSEYTEHICCWVNEICPIKKIVEMCKKNPVRNCVCVDEILELLDIEEINE